MSWRPGLIHRGPILAASLLAVALGWTALWTTASFFNPLAFALLWTGTALFLWAVSGSYPGPMRHMVLASISIPLWWYFEAINLRTENWEYPDRYRYSNLQFGVLATVAFATVVPAISSATDLMQRLLPDRIRTNGNGTRTAGFVLIALGVLTETAVLIYPTVFYPLVWVAPFLVVDGAVTLAGGSSISLDLLRGKVRKAAMIGAAGLLCGVLWEFWNFWSYPKWTYDIPLLDFAPLFEMPILGYGGYIPFSWSVTQLIALVDRASGMRNR